MHVVMQMLMHVVMQMLMHVVMQISNDVEMQVLMHVVICRDAQVPRNSSHTMTSHNNTSRHAMP